MLRCMFQIVSGHFYFRTLERLKGSMGAAVVTQPLERSCKCFDMGHHGMLEKLRLHMKLKAAPLVQHHRRQNFPQNHLELNSVPINQG